LINKIRELLILRDHKKKTMIIPKKNKFKLKISIPGHILCNINLKRIFKNKKSQVTQHKIYK